MREYRGLENVEPEANCVVSVGTFDGVHMGHRLLVQRVKELAAGRGGPATIVTFDPHPQLVVARSNRPPIRILTTHEEKRDILAALGVERLVVIDFTPEFAALSAEEFVVDVLVRRVGCSAVVVGPNHGFGRGRQGTAEGLRELGRRFGFDVDVVQPAVVGGIPVSSTRIRHLLADEGDVRLAARLLERHYEVRGVVVRGDGRGRELGFPTANLDVDSPHKLLPKDGIYAGLALVRGKLYRAAVSVGVRPTFGGGKRVVEAHLIDGADDLYGTRLRLFFVERIRDEERFATSEQLVRRMRQDVEETLRILEGVPEPSYQ